MILRLQTPYVQERNEQGWTGGRKRQRVKVKEIVPHAFAFTFAFCLLLIFHLLATASRAAATRWLTYAP
jgi:hypothetical protein